MSARRQVVTTALLGLFAAMVIIERKRPLRRRVDPHPLRRAGRNLALAGTTAAAIKLCERPLVMPLSRVVDRHKWGILPSLELPAPAEVLLGVLLMDYTLYIWHVLTHKVAFLWRFHRVHHADLDLDATTAIRFHFGEFMLGIPYRLAQVGVLGIRPRTLAIWEFVTLAEILFHHSNMRLPARIERRLSKVLVTPRMHGIHHSQASAETNSNWSTILSVWDRMHGTFRPPSFDSEPVIGAPDLEPGATPLLPALIALPFIAAPEAAHGQAPRTRGPLA